MKTLPDDFVTSNVDLAATIFQLAGVQTPNDYQMDGVSYLDDVVASINDPDFDQVADGEGSCEYKYLDIKNSHSMVSGQYQYIFRATDSVDTMYDVDKLYPNTYDLEQLYDLEMDPNQKQNIFNDASRMMANKDVISKFETLMRIYIDDHCIATNGAQCVKPDLRFGTSGGLYDLPTTTANGPSPRKPSTTTPSPTMSPAPIGGGSGSGTGTGCTEECCSDDDCRGTKVCSAGVCERERTSGSGSSSSDGTCSSDGDCRGSQVCTDGACGRSSSSSSGSGGGGSGSGSSSRGGGRGGNGMESMESMEEQMAFNGMITAETKSGFSLQNATVNVSTLLMMFGMAMTVMIAR